MLKVLVMLIFLATYYFSKTGWGDFLKKNWAKFFGYFFEILNSFGKYFLESDPPKFFK